MPDSCSLQNTANCTVERCPLDCAQVEYLPTLSSNAVYAAAFGLLLIVQLRLGIKYKTWGFTVGMICGLLLVVVGYAGRIMLHDNPFDFNNFIIYLVPQQSPRLPRRRPLSLPLPHHHHLRTQTSHFSPRTYVINFMTSDFSSFVLQGVGGELAATANDNSGSEAGRATMVAGVVFQVVSLLIFMGLWLEFIFRLRRTSESAKNIRYVELRNTKKFTWFQYALGAAVVLIFIRSIYRVAELQQGFNEPIASNEVSFVILEGPMIFLTVLAVTVLRSGIALWYCVWW